MYRTEWAIYDGSLYFKVVLPRPGGRPSPCPWAAAGRSTTAKSPRVLPPPGYAPRTSIPSPRTSWTGCTSSFPGSAAEPRTGTAFDYLYRAEDLKYFKGKRLSGPAQPCEQVPEDLRQLVLPVPSPRRTCPPGHAVPGPVRRPAGTRSAAAFHEDIAKTQGGAGSLPDSTTCWAGCCWWTAQIVGLLPGRSGGGHPVRPHREGRPGRCRGPIRCW